MSEPEPLKYFERELNLNPNRYLKRFHTLAISPEKHLRIRPTAAATPTLYGLPKLHKENATMGPILSSIGSSNHECAVWLSEILTPLRHRQTTVKDISNLSASDKIMASLDVKNFFTNVPVNFATDLVLKSVFSNNITEFLGLNKFQLKKLHWTSKGSVFQFNEQLLGQIDGDSMGSPIAALLADVCMNWVLDQIPNNITQPNMLIRYVDDLLCTFSDCNQLDNYFQSISNSQRWSRGHKARGQGQPFRGQTLSRPRTQAQVFFKTSVMYVSKGRVPMRSTGSVEQSIELLSGLIQFHFYLWLRWS